MLMVSDSRYQSLLKLDNHRIHHQRQSLRVLRQATELFNHIDRVLLIVDTYGKQQVMPLFAAITGRLHVDTPANWLELVHIDDRPQVEKEVNIIVEGFRESRELRFRLAKGNESFEYVECVFRTLHLAGQQRVYALSLKHPVDQSVLTYAI